MQTHTLLTRCAGSAIAAALALGSTPLLAQAAPAPDPPVTVRSAPVQPAPAQAVQATPQIPAVGQAPASPQPIASPQMTSEPVVQDVPVVQLPDVSEAGATPAEVQAAPEPMAATPAQPEPVPAPAERSAAPVAELPSTDNDAGFGTAPLVERDAADTLAVPEAAPVEPALDEAVQADEGNAFAEIMAVLAALAVIAGGIVLLRRRQKGDAPHPAPVIRPHVAATPAPLAGRPAVPAPVVPARESEARPSGATNAAPAPRGPALVSQGASVALPRELPASFEERDALLRKMIQAKPDRANPFVSPKARTKRARLILQSLGRKFEGVEPWIDFSQYPGNWPELRRNYAAAA